MTTLEEIMARVEALKKDLEGLGVEVEVSIAGVSRGGMKGPSVTLIGVIVPELEEDLEAVDHGF